MVPYYTSSILAKDIIFCKFKTMYRLKYLILLLLICHFAAEAQTYTVKATPEIKFLYQYNKPIISITNTSNIKLFDIIVGNHKFKFKNIIKTNNGLYVLFNGTGQVFKATNLHNDFIDFTRIDSTWNFGNNNFSIDFEYKDTLYSFGGYGYWHCNGQLRHFDLNGHEWHIEKINAIYPALQPLYHLDFERSDTNKQSSIYYITGPNNNEEINLIDNNYTVIKFNIVTKENTVLGIFNDKLKLRVAPSIDIPSLGGLLINTLRDYYLLKFNTNEVYKLSNKSIIELFNTNDLQNTFEINRKLYFTTIKDSNLSSINISINDFTKEPYQLYLTENIATKYWYLIIDDWYLLVIIGILAFIFIAYYKTNSGNNKKKESQKIYSLPEEGSNNDFTELEKIIIEKIIERSNNKGVFTVEEMNLHLGIKRKTLEIQKKVRNESINRINHKFNVNFDLDTIFIERTRSAEDRRFFNYIINPENANLYRKIKSTTEG